MTNQQSLSNELVKHILGILGLVKPYVKNVIGITFDKYKQSKITIDFDDETGEQNFPIYSASTESNNSIIKVLGLYLTDGDAYEFITIFRCDDFPVFGLKFISNEENTIFLVSKNGTWEIPSMAEKLMACSGLELLNNAGIIWKPEPVGDFLHSCLLEFVDM